MNDIGSLYNFPSVNKDLVPKNAFPVVFHTIML